MGRWPYSDRLTVEECMSISTKCLNQHGYFDGGVRWGGMSWSCNGQELGSIGFVVSTVEGNEYIRFQYTHTDSYTDEKTELDYKARLTWTPCYFGGRRWWFICPLVVDGQVCRRRVGVLYLGGVMYFGCRLCYDITYRSSQESHALDRMFRELGMNPKQAKTLFKEDF